MLFSALGFRLAINNKTGLQPVSMTVEQVHYFKGWVDGAKSLWCPDFAEIQIYRSSGAICIKVGIIFLIGCYTEVRRTPDEITDQASYKNLVALNWTKY